MTERKRDQEARLLLCELASIDGCIERWLEILELIAQDKQSASEYYDKLCEYGLELPELEARTLEADRIAFEKVQGIIEMYQDKEDRIEARLSEME